MSFPRQAVRSIRSLHTTSRIFNETPAKSLGFGDYTGRTRSLPTIDIPASSRRDVGSKRPTIKLDTKSNEKRPPRIGNAKAAGARKFPEDKNRRQSKSPLQPATTEGGDEFFTMSADTPSSSKSKGQGKKDNRKTSMDVVDIDFKPEQISANSTSNSRSKRNTRTASSSRKPQGEARGQKGGARSTGSEPAKRENDTSTEGIFGRASLLFPMRMGARQAEQSIWAEGMKSEDGTFLSYSCCMKKLMISTKGRTGTFDR
jgi:hypothetical protein